MHGRPWLHVNYGYRRLARQPPSRIMPSFFGGVGPEKLRVFYIQLLKDRKVETKRAPD